MHQNVIEHLLLFRDCQLSDLHRDFVNWFAFIALTPLVGWQEGHTACKKTEWWGAGMVICLEWRAYLHTAQLMPLPLTVSCFSKIQIGFTFLLPALSASPGQRAVKPVCVCVCVFLSTEIRFTLSKNAVYCPGLMDAACVICVLDAVCMVCVGCRMCGLCVGCRMCDLCVGCSMCDLCVGCSMCGLCVGSSMCGLCVGCRLCGLCVCAEVGFGLRKDDPTTLHQLLIDVHSKSSTADVAAFNDPYVSECPCLT